MSGKNGAVGHCALMVCALGLLVMAVGLMADVARGQIFDGYDLYPLFENPDGTFTPGPDPVSPDLAQNNFDASDGMTFVRRPIPEPATLVSLLGFALMAGLYFLSRRSRSK